MRVTKINSDAGSVMDEKLKKLIASREKAEARLREIKRKQQERASKISEQERIDDTRRKILAGSWALDAAEKSPEFRAQMMRAFDNVWLWRDDDRALYGLKLLSEEEKVRRELAYGKSGRKKAKHADASASRSEGSADASTTQLRETEAA